MTEPLFITTDSGRVLPFSTLELFAIKSGEKSQAIPVDRFQGQYGSENLIQPLYNMEALIQLLEINVFHFRACSLKANDVIGFGWTLISTNDEFTPEEKEVEQFFNEGSLKPTLIDAVMDYESIGILAVEVIRELYAPDGKLVKLAHIPGHTIRPHVEGDRFLQVVGVKKRWFKKYGLEESENFDLDKVTGAKHPLGSLSPEKRATEVIWGRSFSGRSDWYGIAPAIPALGAIEGMRALRDYNIDFFKHYGMPAYAVYISGDYDLGKKIRTRLESDGTGTLGEFYTGATGQTVTNFEYPIVNEIKSALARVASNPHSPILLAVPSKNPESKVEVKFEKLATETKDASFRLYKKDNRDEILAAHGVPEYRLGISETGSLGGSTAEEASKIYRDSVINPLKEKIENLINEAIIWKGFQVETLRWTLNGLGVDESKDERDVADFLFQRGAMTPNEIRVAFGERFGLEYIPDVPELDGFYINNQPIAALAPEETGETATALKGLRDDLLKLGGADDLHRKVKELLDKHGDGG